MKNARRCFKKINTSTNYVDFVYVYTFINALQANPRFLYPL